MFKVISPLVCLVVLQLLHFLRKIKLKDHFLFINVVLHVLWHTTAGGILTRINPFEIAVRAVLLYIRLNILIFNT